MSPKIRSLLSLLAVALLTAGAVFIVHPKGSKINLNPVKIPFQKEYKLRLGLDLQGGSRLVYQADFKDVSEADRAVALEGVRDTIERRVNSFGVAEPVVQSTGNDKIIIELPGVKDINEAIKQIGETPLLDFRTQNPNPEQEVGADGNINIDPNSFWSKTNLSGKNLKKASADILGAGTKSYQQSAAVKLEFDDEGTKAFAALTEANIGKQIGIFIDNQLLSAPTVNAVIKEGIAYIEGGFTTKDAKLLAQRLNSGALPVPISLVSQENVGATLGNDSIHKSVVAGLIGMLLIALFMLLYYRLPGLLAVVALGVYTVLSLAVFKIGISPLAIVLVGFFFFLSLVYNPKWGILALVSYLGLLMVNTLAPVTLTLAGIAGFILSIGMAVDANILIFERTREEIRSGKDVEKSLSDGFARAWSSIRDSNISSLITTAILYMYGTPSIKGFAVTLAVGILISMFTAITVTKTLLKVFVTGKMLTHPWLFGVSRGELKTSK